MKKILTLLVITAVVIGIAGCTRVLTDMELLEQTFANMQEMESYKAQGSITVKFMGMTTEPFLYEMLYEKPDKSYLKMDADIFGIGERITVEYLIQGGDIKLRSTFLDEAEPGYREVVEESLVADIENPRDYENTFMELADMVNFEIIDNPDGLDAKKYKTYKFVLDGEKLKQKIAEDMKLEEEYLPPEYAELNEEEQAAYLEMVDELLAQLDVAMEAVMVVDTGTKHFHSLQMDMAMDMPIPVPFGDSDEMEKIRISYNIEIEYLEINTEIEFPSFD